MELITTSIRITGSGVSPETVSASDLAQVIMKFEQSIVQTANAGQNAVEGDGSGLFVSLVGIEPGSERLVFKVTKAAAVVIGVIANAINAQSYDMMPNVSQERIHELSSLIVRRQWAFEIEANPASNIQSAVISDASPVPQPKDVLISGTKTLKGVLVKIGGDTSPRAELRLDNGDLLRVELTREMAQGLGSRLYREVCLEGVAWLRLPGREIERYVVNRVFDYRPKSPIDAFQELASLTLGNWGKTDPNRFVKSLREGK